VQKTANLQCFSFLIEKNSFAPKNLIKRKIQNKGNFQIRGAAKFNLT
jgi:hypothetical protein